MKLWTRHRLTDSFFLIVRAFCLVFMTFKYSELNETSMDDCSLNLAIRLLLDLPTLLLIAVFSAFAYYLSRLNQEVETILHQIDESNSY